MMQTTANCFTIKPAKLLSQEEFFFSKLNPDFMGLILDFIAMLNRRNFQDHETDFERCFIII